MKAMILLMFLNFLGKGESLHEEAATGRLMAVIEVKASFSPEDFAGKVSAELIEIDPRNPYLALDTIDLGRPLIVLSKPLEKGSAKRLAADRGYRFISFGDESLELAVKKWNELLETIPVKSSEIPYITLEDSKRIYSLMEKIDKVFSRNGILYWIGAGTLLGAIRHKGLIPWDDDLDIYMLDSDFSKLERAKEDFKKEGLLLYHYHKDTYKIFEKDADRVRDPKNPKDFLPFGFPAADLFTVVLQRKNEKSDVYILKSRFFFWDWPGDKYTFDQIQNVTRAPFGPLMIPIPGDPELNLNANYGTEKFPDLWKKYAVEPTWDHRREEVLKENGGIGALVEVDDFSPAPWK